jgi:hypothetical protein
MSSLKSAALVALHGAATSFKADNCRGGIVADQEVRKNAVNGQ